MGPRDQGVEVAVWTVDDREEMETVLTLQPDMIVSSKRGAAREAVVEIFKKSQCGCP